MKTPEQYADQINKENGLGSWPFGSETEPQAIYDPVTPQQLTGPLLDAYKAGMTEAVNITRACAHWSVTQAILAARDAKTSL